MRTIGFFFGIFFVFVLNGCSSIDNSAEKVAQSACQAFRQGSVVDLKALMNDEERTKFSKVAEPLLSKMFKTKNFKENAVSIDCAKPTKVHKYDENRYKYSYGTFRTKVKNVKGKWVIAN